MGVKTKLGIPEHTEEVGLVTAEIYFEDDIYHLFIVGDTVKSLIRSSNNLQDCKEEISRLQQLADSDLFRNLVAAQNL